MPLLFFKSALAQPLDLVPKQQISNLNNYISVFESDSEVTHIKNVIDSDRFVPNKGKDTAAGFDSAGVWLKIDIKISNLDTKQTLEHFKEEKFTLVLPFFSESLLQEAAAYSEQVMFSPYSKNQSLSAIDCKFQSKADKNKQMLDTSRYKGIHILFVEDNVVNQQVGTTILKKLGCDFTVVDDVEKAVAQASNNKFDLILMDIHLQIIDGLEATKQIKSNSENTQTPIIALSADVFAESLTHYQSIGGQDYLTKPYRIGDLIEKLDKYCLSAD